jgi:hypothetical protein
LLGEHGVKLGLQLIPGRGYGVLLVEERDGAFKLAPEVAQLEGRQLVQGVLGRLDGRGVGGHWLLSSMSLRLDYVIAR